VKAKDEKKIVCFALCAMLLALCPPAYAQQPKVYRIGILLPGGALYETIEGLKAGLRELGLKKETFTLTITDTKGDVKAGGGAAKNFERDNTDPRPTTARKQRDVPSFFCVDRRRVFSSNAQNSLLPPPPLLHSPFVSVMV